MLGREGYTDVAAFADPVEALQDCLRKSPDLVLLDLRMPRIDGFEVLARLQPADEDDWLPVIVLTAERGGEAKRRALSAGARDYITKPFDREEAMLRIRNVLHTHMLHQRLAVANDALEEVVEGRTVELGVARLEILERLAAAGEFRDDATGEHAVRVGIRSAQLARTMGRPEREIQLIRNAATLHDIGKLGVADRVLLKGGKLNEAESAEMKKHAAIGAELLSGSDSPLLQMAEEIALSHHERWDGTGYPSGLAGEAIPLTGRIVAVADVFDALTQDRPYHDAWALDTAIKKIESERGRHFDPRVVDAFADSIGALMRPSHDDCADDPELASSPAERALMLV
jgi:putative two-component system response regulator